MQHTSRLYNSTAHSVAKKALSTIEPIMWMNDCPFHLLYLFSYLNYWKVSFLFKKKVNIKFVGFLYVCAFCWFDQELYDNALVLTYQLPLTSSGDLWACNPGDWRHLLMGLEIWRCYWSEVKPTATAMWWSWDMMQKIATWIVNIPTPYNVAWNLILSSINGEDFN